MSTEEMDRKKARISALREEHRDTKTNLRRLESNMLEEVLNFSGSIEDALRLGLIKLNFPAPDGFMAHLRRTR